MIWIFWLYIFVLFSCFSFGLIGVNGLKSCAKGKLKVKASRHRSRVSQSWIFHWSNVKTWTTSNTFIFTLLQYTPNTSRVTQKLTWCQKSNNFPGQPVTFVIDFLKAMSLKKNLSCLEPPRNLYGHIRSHASGSKISLKQTDDHGRHEICQKSYTAGFSGQKITPLISPYFNSFGEKTQKNEWKWDTGYASLRGLY